MAAGVFNISKGKVNAFYDRVNDNDPSTSGIIIVPVDRGVVTDATLEDFDTLAAILAGGVTERSTNGWGRKTLTDADLAGSVVDDTNNRRESTFSEQTWTAVALAGGASTDLIVCYAPDVVGADSTIVPLTWHTFAVTPDGTDVLARTPNGVFRAS